MKPLDSQSPSVPTLARVWRWLVEPPASIADLEERRRSRYLNIFLFTLLCVGVLAQAEYFWRMPILDLGSAVVFGGILLMGLAYLLNRRGHMQLAIVVAIGAFISGTFLAVLFSTNKANDWLMLIYLVIPLLLADALLPTRAFLVFAGIIMLGALVLLPSFTWFNTSARDLFPYLLICTTIITVLSYYRREVDNARLAALRASEQRYRALAEAARDMILIVREEEWLAEPDVWEKLRDKETEGHTQRVTEMTLQLARAFGVPETELVHIRRGALLHDIGKMGVPDAILLKAGPLNEQEWEIMRRHPALAYEMLSPIAFLRPALDIPYCHHEKWDGTGYPRGLSRELIPLAARIFAVVDVWDALRSDRPYRAGWADEQVREYLTLETGTHFDPRVVQRFLNLLDAPEAPE